MEEFAVKNFTFQDIKEAAPADKILFAYIELAEEKTAFELGGGDYSAPCQTIGDFLNNISSKKRVSP